MRPERAAAEVLRRAGLGRVPIDVRAVAESLDADIVVAPISTPGRLEQCDGRLRVLVQDGTGAGRRRFTIAHELGHVWVRQQGLRFDRVETEEHFCNRFASALLLPQPWVTTWRGEESLERLSEIATIAEVSLAAALLAARRDVRWTSTLLRWRHQSGDWRLFAVTGANGARRYLSSSAATREVLGALVGRRGTVRGRLPLAFDGVPVEISAEVLVRPLSAIALLSGDELGRLVTSRPPHSPTTH